MSIKDIFKGIVGTVAVGALVVGGTTVATAQHTTKAPSVHTCAARNIEAKADGWADLFRGKYVGKRISIKEKERMVAADLENAAQNMREGNYRHCWGE